MSGEKLVHLHSRFESQNAADLRGCELARLESIEGYLLKNMSNTIRGVSMNVRDVSSDISRMLVRFAECRGGILGVTNRIRRVTIIMRAETKSL